MSKFKVIVNRIRFSLTLCKKTIDFVTSLKLLGMPGAFFSWMKLIGICKIPSLYILNSELFLLLYLMILPLCDQCLCIRIVQYFFFLSDGSKLINVFRIIFNILNLYTKLIIVCYSVFLGSKLVILILSIAVIIILC